MKRHQVQGSLKLDGRIAFFHTIAEKRNPKCKGPIAFLKRGLANTWTYFLVRTYSVRDTSKRGGDNTEYELVDHEFENEHVSKSSEGTIPCLRALVLSTYIAKRFRGDAIGVGWHQRLTWNTRFLCVFSV